MARRRYKKKRGGRKRGIPIAATFGLAFGLWETYKHVSQWKNANAFVEAFTGYSPERKTWSMQYFKMLPAYAGIGVSMAASKIGLNRYTPRYIRV